MLRTAQSLPLKGFRRWASTRTVSSPSRQPATGLPGDYPDRTHTGWRRRASDSSQVIRTPPKSLGALPVPGGNRHLVFRAVRVQITQACRQLHEELVIVDRERVVDAAATDERVEHFRNAVCAVLLRQRHVQVLRLLLRYGHAHHPPLVTEQPMYQRQHLLDAGQFAGDPGAETG